MSNTGDLKFDHVHVYADSIQPLHEYKALEDVMNRFDAAIGGVRDPREVMAPFIEAMLSVRATVRAEKRFDLSDIIRDVFASLNIEVRDTPTGVEWSLPTE